MKEGNILYQFNLKRYRSSSVLVQKYQHLNKLQARHGNKDSRPSQGQVEGAHQGGRCMFCIHPDAWALALSWWVTGKENH